MERRGRIPVATFRTPEGKTRSRSRVRDPNYNKSDPDTDLFTLLEDNIALREENEALTAKNNTGNQQKLLIEKENAELKTKVKDLLSERNGLKSQILHVNQTLNKMNDEKNSIKISQQENIDRVKKLTAQLEELQNAQKDYARIIETNRNFKLQIDKLMPAVNSNDFESLIDTQKDSSNFIAIECIQKLLSEFTHLKSTLNTTELQLYEANEKISELLENQNHLDEENENLKVENTSLTRVAELMTTNMRESVTTGKKMEEALIAMKKRNDDLVKRGLDSLDSPITPPPDEEIIRLREEITKRDLAHGERIVEMKKLMDTAIENSNNDEIKVLRLKLDMIENDLKEAIDRAEKAERELEKMKMHFQISTLDGNKEFSNKYNSENDTNNSIFLSPPPPPSLPPPPPPPLPDFKFPTTTTSNPKGVRSLNDSITSCNLRSGGVGAYDDSSSSSGGGPRRDSGGSYDTSGDNLLRKQQVEATGIDSLVRELKSGNVTLRRARRKTKTNAALQEMFDVLEKSKKQNRNSQILIENHLTHIDMPQTNF